MQTPLERLRSAWAFLEMQRASGLTWGALERRYIADTAPQRLERGVRKPDSFLRYIKGVQVPRGPSAVRSPVRWALEHHPAFALAYKSPLFELLRLSDRRNDLIDFARVIYDQSQVSDELLSCTIKKSERWARRRLYSPIWNHPRNVLGLRRKPEPDALCLILIALKANSGHVHENPCLRICAEWLQEWVKQTKPHENLVACMLQTLSECLPGCKALVEGGAWKTLKVDLADLCFEPSPEETMREALMKSLLKPPTSRP